MSTTWIRRIFRSLVAVLLLAPLFVLASPTAEAQGGVPYTGVSFGDTWSYLDNGSNQGTAWRAVGFNDSSWATGPAELGYGDNDEATVVSFGPTPSNKYVTTYFRNEFTAPAGVNSAQIAVVRDDGVAVYVNGVQVATSNLPGSFNYLTNATATVGGANESTPVVFTIDHTLIQAGVNTIAVEVHQANANSSDMSFDLELTGTVAGGDTTPPTVPGGLAQTGNTETTIDLAWSPSTDNVGVVSYQVFRNGALVGNVAHPNTVFTDNGLAFNTSYTYRVSASDADGNTSALSGGVSASTTSTNSMTFSEIPDNFTWQTNGELNYILPVGDTVFIGGEFTNVNNNNGSSMSRNNLAAINRVTGQPTSFDPNLNGKVFGMTVSPDGQTLYVVGSFTTSNGVSRKRIAAYDIATGALTDFKPPSPNRSTRGVATDGTTLYIGGLFDKVGSEFRSRVAAYDIATETLTSFAPSADGPVKNLLLDPARLWFAGDFDVVNGAGRGGLASVDFSGSLLPGDSPGHASLDLAALGDRIFVAVAGPGGGRGQAFNRTTGAFEWSAHVDGNVQGVATLGDYVYFGGHYELIFDTNQVVDRLTRHNPATGALDTSWLPSPNGSRSVNDVAAAGNSVFIGGDFTFVTNRKHVGFAQFTDAPPDAQLVSLTMLDKNENGYVDTVEAVFNKQLAACAWPCTTGVNLINPPSGATLASVTTSGFKATFNLNEGGGAPKTSVSSFKVELPSTTGILATDGARAMFDKTAPADGAAPVFVAVTKTNAGTSGIVETGDTIKFTYSEPIDPASLPGGTTVLSIINGGNGIDRLRINGILNGSVNLGAGSFIQSGQANFTSALSLESGNTRIRVTLGACSGGCAKLTRGPQRTIRFFAAPGVTDLAGNSAIKSITKTFRPF